MARTDQSVPIGQAGLIARLGLRVPPPAVTSVSGPGGRTTVIEDGRVVRNYPPGYRPEDTLVGHLRFALRYEPILLGVLRETFRTAEARAGITAWVRAEPNGIYARRAWFLCEWLTGARLELPDAGIVTYADALDRRLQVTARGVRSRRHKVNDNILGCPGFAPIVRRTDRIDAFRGQAIAAEARAVVAASDPGVLIRAVTYLFTKETRSSFAIEHAPVTGGRAERFVAALRTAERFDPGDPAQLIALQNAIVDPRYAAHGPRNFQNFVGETVGGYRERVHFIPPRPGDVPTLLRDWARMAARLRGAADPVVAAALIAFGFVFIHPFEDGNGRIHRFLIHHVLSVEGFTPPAVLFPVSAAILRDRRGYDAALETFSEAILPCIDWHWTPAREIEVTNDTADLYRYFDATALAEFLCDKTAETVRRDLREEIGFVAMHDAGLAVVREIVDMPDRRASLLVRLCMQNGGGLPRARRALFAELSDSELAAIETGIRDALAARPL